MFVFKLFIVVLPFQFVWSLTIIEEKYLTNQLMDYFEDESVESNGAVIATANQKREALSSSSAEEVFAFLFSPVNLTSRANHYWTRKRGREKTDPPQTDWDIYYTLYPTRSMPNFNNGKSSLQNKREANAKFLRLNKVYSREKRDTEVDDSVPVHKKSEKETLDESLKLPENAENKNQETPKWNGFGRKQNRCCNKESEISAFNQTLSSAKTQCMIETRKMMKKFNASEDTINGDGGLYNIFSCERTNRWKTMVTCTIDCVADKIGMFDSKNIINVEVTKQIVLENFAKETWEQDISNDLVDKCAKIVAKSTSKDINAFGVQCSSKAAEFVYCMWREMFLTCPQDKQENSRPCEKLRSVLIKFDDNKFKN